MRDAQPERPPEQPPERPPERAQRQRDLVPPAALASSSATVIGVGAVGRQVAQQLAAIGVPQLTLIDPDVVETVNLATQAYLEEDLGAPKAEATARQCARLNSAITVEPVIRRFQRHDEVADTVFACVDSIHARRLIWESVRDRCLCFVDARMSGETIRVLAAADDRSRAHYPATLFHPSEAHTGPCTGRSTVYAATAAAALMVHQFTRQLRRLPVDADTTLNLVAGEWTVQPD